MTICLLCGGVGGARAALALAETLPHQQLTVVVNTGDDFRYLDLDIWPDWDTVAYTLAGVIEPQRGWGRADEGTRILEELARWPAPDWFHLGDRDVALHLYRSWALRQHSAPQVAERIAHGLGLSLRLWRVTEESLNTTLRLRDQRTLAFQDWFVRERGLPPVQAVESPTDRPLSPGVAAAVRQADLVLLAPSNPYLSLFPMLRLESLAEALRARTGPTWAVSPLVGGQAVKGPLDRLLRDLHPDSSGQQAIIDLYSDWVEALLLPAEEIAGLQAGPTRLLPCRTWLTQPQHRAEFVSDLLQHWKERPC